MSKIRISVLFSRRSRSQCASRLARGLKSNGLPVALWLLIAAMALFSAGVFFTTGCGGGGGDPEPTAPPVPKPIVVLDPGHGGGDSGAVGNGLQEKDVNLTISLNLRTRLQQAGCTVYMTRDSDVSVSLADRASFANSKQADIFVSIHANSSTSTGAHGTGAVYANASDRIGKSRNLAYSIYDSMTSYYDSWQPPYANRCGSGTCVVLNNTRMPAVIVETLFISNADDAYELANYPYFIASLISDGITDHLWSAGFSVMGSPAASGSGGDGGLESWPTWWDWENGSPRFATPLTSTLRPAPLWQWANEVAQPPVSGTSLRDQAALTYTIPLTDLLPLDAISNTTRLLLEPASVIGSSNAEEALAADYMVTISDTDVVTAAVVVFRSIGEPYSHDYGVCTRFKEGHLVHVAPITASTGITDTPYAYFWGARMRKPGSTQEDATVFAVYVSEDEQTFTVDSRWIREQYPISNTGYILTFQIWAADPHVTAALAGDVLENLASRGTLHYQNDLLPAAPLVFISEAVYGQDQATLLMTNRDEVTRTVAYTAVTWSAPYPESEAIYYFTRQVPPGLSVVELPMPARLNGVIYAGAGDFLDAVYVADGHWWSYDSSPPGSTPSITLISQDCAQGTNLTPDDRILAGCGEITGTVGVNGLAGMVRALTPPGVPAIDVSRYGALTFFARGDGKSYRVKIEQASVQDYDYHELTFTAPPEWKQFVIPLSSFKQQGWGQAVPFTGVDVRAVTWESAGNPLDGKLNLAVDRVAFTNSTVISATEALPDTTDETGPYTVSAEMSDDQGIEAATLFYSLDGGVSFTPVTMTASGNVFGAAIPGQPLETEVQYYVQAGDADGNVATDPVDIPCTVYRFQVSRHPSLLAEDFCDTSPVNVLGGRSWVFAQQGGSALSRFGDGALRLDFDVTAPGAYAGYVTHLDGADLNPYRTLAMQVRGSDDGIMVKAGLNDGQGHEPKIELGEYLPRGVITEARTVRIPLVAFAAIEDWTGMDKLTLTFEEQIGSGSGTLYVDDVRFEQAPVPVIVHSFNDLSGSNGVGGSIWTGVGGGASITAELDAVNRREDFGYGLRIGYSDVTDTEWALWGTDLMGVDASRYDILSFYIKGGSGGETPNVYLSDGNDRRYLDVEGSLTVTTEWQQVQIPLADFAALGIDLTHVSYLQFAFEWQAMEGEIYVDDIALVESGTHWVFLPVVLRLSHR